MLKYDGHTAEGCSPGKAFLTVNKSIEWNKLKFVGHVMSVSCKYCEPQPFGFCQCSECQI